MYIFIFYGSGGPTDKPKMPAEELKREVEKERELQKLAVVTVE